MEWLRKLLVAVFGATLAAVPAPSFAVVLFDADTDTIQGSTSISFGASRTAVTYEARILFTSTYVDDGFVFNEWTFGSQDNFLIVGPAELFGYAFPVNFAPPGNPIGAATTVSLNAWHHVAYSYDGTTERLFLDGNVAASRSGSGQFGDTNALPFIGSIARDGIVAPSFHGYLDTLRISDIARYTANFVAPTGDLATDANTLLLYNFDEAPGSTTTADSSGKGNTGTLGVGFRGATLPEFVADPLAVTPPSAMPEPTSLVLLGTGLLGFAVFRRRVRALRG